MMNFRGAGLIEELSQQFIGGTGENHGNPVRIAGVPV
jgi:hypothetical protein